MTISATRLPRGALLAAMAAAAACSSGGGHSPETTPPPTNDCELAPAVAAGQPFALSGTVVYDFVPARYSPATESGGLDFSAVEQRPVRGADLQVRQCGNVLATGATDAAGHYAVTFVPTAQGQVSVYVVARTASPPIQVQDNTAGGAIWTVAQPLLSAAPTLDVHATHGWTGASYGPGRIAAPFAILDSMYTASRRLLDLPRDVPLPPLQVNWSPLNYPCTSTSCSYNPASGNIITSHYVGNAIYILGKTGVDTDEFDREVIVHEWAHYFEDDLSRADSPGGSHGFGDVLDPRLAFSEGYASAFAAMLLDQPIYADTGWPNGSMDAFGWDVENVPTPTDDPSPGPFSELSVIRAMWDLYDGPGTPGSTTEAWDTIATGLAPIYDTLVGPERTTPALTTIASFVTGLKAQAGVDATAVKNVLAHYTIGDITSAFGDGDPRMRAMYAPVTSFPWSRTVTFDAGYYPNEQPQNQYFVFTAGPSTTHVTVSSACTSDVDLYAYHLGQLLAVADSTSGNETIGFPTTPGETYVVLLNGWGGYTNPVSGGPYYDATVSFASP